MYSYIVDNLYYYYNKFYSIETVKDVIDNVEHVTEEIKEITENVEHVTEEIKEATENVEHVTEEIKEATENIEQIINNVEKVINNDEIDEYIKKIIQEMNQYYLNDSEKRIE